MTTQGRLVGYDELMQTLSDNEIDRDDRGNFKIFGADSVIVGMGGEEVIVTESLMVSKGGEFLSLLDLLGGPRCTIIE